jgi:bisphosphoglycerate-dependent phosphoglycerate mutase
MHKIVLLRHGESVWPRKSLHRLGRRRAHSAGSRGEAGPLLLDEAHFAFDVAFTSGSSDQDAWTVLETWTGCGFPSSLVAFERAAPGAPQGSLGAETAAKFDAQVKIWRRAYGHAAAAAEDGDPNGADDPRYAEIEHSAFRTNV